MLLKCGTIAYQKTNMRGLISVAQTPGTSALAQVTICPGSDPPRVERVAGEGIKNTVKMWYNRLSDRRHAQTIIRRADASDLCPLPGDDPSRSAPPRVERVAGEGIPYAVETRHNRRGRKTCTDCSPLLRRLRPLPSPRCPSQLPNYPSISSTQMP